MFMSFRFKDILPLMAAIVLIAATFALPPYLPKEDAGEAVSVFAEGESVLIIDAGHGGADGGAVAADGSPESDINLAIAQKLESLAGLFGVQTVMTRTAADIDYPADADTISEMKKADQHARLELINSVPGGVMVSIHQNYYPDSRPSGAQVLYAPSSGSQELGELMHSMLLGTLCPDDRRVASPADKDIYLMKYAKCPAVLVECGFISNPDELTLLKSDGYQKKLAAVLLAAYMQYDTAQDGISV